MPNTMDHERHRFRTMDESQLRVRLRKITDPLKLQNFIEMCREYGYTRLLGEAQTKLNQRTYGGNEWGTTEEALRRGVSTANGGSGWASNFGDVPSNRPDGTRPIPVVSRRGSDDRENSGLGRREVSSTVPPIEEVREPAPEVRQPDPNERELREMHTGVRLIKVKKRRRT